MRLGRSVSSRGATVVVCAMLAWSVVGWVMGPADAGAPIVHSSPHPSIERVDVLAVIASDRPVSSTRHERGGSPRAFPGLADAAASSTSFPPIAVGDGGFPASLLSLAPLSFGLARRGPPSSVSR